MKWWKRVCEHFTTWWQSWDIEDILKSQAALVAEAEGKREEEENPLSAQESLNRALRDSARLRIEIERLEGMVNGAEAESVRLGSLASDLQTQVRELQSALGAEQRDKMALALNLEGLRAEALRPRSSRQKSKK